MSVPLVERTPVMTAHVLNVWTLMEATHVFARLAIREMGELANHLVINLNIPYSRKFGGLTDCLNNHQFN